jgi:hypothetical protein
MLRKQQELTKKIEEERLAMKQMRGDQANEAK